MPSANISSQLDGDLRELWQLLEQGGRPVRGSWFSDCKTHVGQLRHDFGEHVESAEANGFLSAVRDHRPELRVEVDKLHDFHMRLLNRCERLLGQIQEIGGSSGEELASLRNQMADLACAMDGLGEAEDALVQKAFAFEPSCTE